MLYDKCVWDQYLDDIPITQFKIVNKIVNGETVFCLTRTDHYPNPFANSRAEYEAKYVEINQDGYIIEYRTTAVTYDIPHSLHGLREVIPNLLTVWTKIKRYPGNNLPLLIEHSSGRREIHIRDKKGTLIKKTIKHNGTVSILYGKDNTINLAHGSIDLKKM